jgi:hypothetical protein
VLINFDIAFVPQSPRFFCLVNRKVIKDRLVIWALKGLFLGITLGAILGDFRPYFWDFGLIFLIKALVSLESSGA